MSTSDSAEPDNVYSVRGQSMQIEHDADDHTATFYMADIGSQIDEDASIERQLEDIGIYTRVQDTLDISHSFVKVRLKPAADVELRDADDGRIQERPIQPQLDVSEVSKRRGKYGYTASVPEGLLRDLYDIDEDESVSGSVGEAAVFAELHNDHLCLRVLPEERPHSLKARITSKGEIGLPNGLAAAADLDGHAIDWELSDDGDTLTGHTTFQPESMEMPVTVNWRENPNAHPEDKHHTAAISHVTQEVNGRTQSHFNVYVKSEFVRQLGWGSPPNLYEREDWPTREEVLQDHIDIHLVNIDGELAIYLTNEIRPKMIDTVEIEESDKDDQKWESSVRTSPSVRKLYRNEWNDQITFSFPHSLSYAMEFTDEWYRVSRVPLDSEKIDGATDSEEIVTGETEDGDLVDKVERLRPVSSGKQVTWALTQRTAPANNADADALDLLGEPKDPSDVDQLVPVDEVDAWLEQRGLDRDSGIVERRD